MLENCGIVVMKCKRLSQYIDRVPECLPIISGLCRHYENIIPVHRLGEDINVVRLWTESVQKCRLSRANVAFHGHSECLSASEMVDFNFCIV